MKIDGFKTIATHLFAHLFAKSSCVVNTEKILWIEFPRLANHIQRWNLSGLKRSFSVIVIIISETIVQLRLCSVHKSKEMKRDLMRGLYTWGGDGQYSDYQNSANTFLQGKFVFGHCTQHFFVSCKILFSVFSLAIIDDGARSRAVTSCNLHHMILSHLPSSVWYS